MIAQTSLLILAMLIVVINIRPAVAMKSAGYALALVGPRNAR